MRLPTSLYVSLDFDKVALDLRVNRNLVCCAAPYACVQLRLQVFLEELQQKMDVRQYDMKGVQLQTTPGRKLLVLEASALLD